MINSLNLKPEDWIFIPLKDIAEIRFSSVDKKSYPGEKPVFLCNYVDVYKNDHLTGKEQFMSATATDAEIKYFTIREGDVLITKDSETPDEIAIPTVITGTRSNLLCGYHLALIRPNKAYVNSVFLAKQIENSRLARYFGRMCNGLTRYGLSTASIANAPIWLPPLSEQNQVANILKENDDAILKTEAVIAKLKKIKAGLLHDLLTRGIDENGELRDPVRHPEQFKDSLFGRVPKEWDMPSISELAIYVGSGVTPTGGSQFYDKKGILFIRSQNVTFNGLLLDDVAYIDKNTHKSMSRSEIFAHDVLLNITGASIGRCCPMPEGLGLANVNQHVCAIRIEKPCFEDAIYLNAVLSSFIGQHQIDKYNAGSNRQGLNYQQIRSFLIPWPSNFLERKAIAMVLDSHNERVQIEQIALVKWKLLKKGLMQDLLSGQVRVALEEPMHD